MVTVRSEVAMMTDFTLDDHKAQMIWTVLRCHAIVEDFIALDFRGHTVMVQQMTLYMMTERVDPADMEDLARTVREANKSVLEAAKTVKTLSEALEKSRSDTNDFKRKYESLKSQVDGLSAKVNKIKA